MKTIINTADAPAPLGPYNQAILHNDTLYISGQIAIDATTNQIVPANIEAQTQQIMKNLQAILREAGLDFSNVVKSSIFVKDLSNFELINAVYGRYFDSETAPARETVEVARLPKDVEIEISMVAAKN